MNEPGCGKAKASRRIVSGLPAKEDQFPWTVLLKVHFSILNSRCGATIITPYHILTASHCTVWEGLQPTGVEVLYGSHDLKRSRVVRVTKILRHENYVVKNFNNDIALMEVEKPFPFDGKHVVPICIPSKLMNIVHSPVIIAGWGLTKEDARGPSAPENLLYTKVKVMPSSACFGVFKSVGYRRDIMHCAYETNTDACQGDSGGPMVVQMGDGRFVQVGVVSYGVGCAKNNTPGVYTRLDKYYDWIVRNINNPVAFQQIL